MLDISQFPRSHNADSTAIVFDDVLQLTVSKMTSLRSLDISKSPTQRVSYSFLGKQRERLVLLSTVGGMW